LSYITISKENYFYNLEKISERVKSVDQIAVVLKDNAYGHGLRIIGELAREFGIKRAVVRKVSEALQIADLFDYILILAPEKVEDRWNFFYTINSINDIYKYHKNINIELKIDTGMHRLGISPLELYFALNLIKNSGLRLRGFFTHFREADEVSSSLFTQKELFKILKDNVLDSCFNDINIHSHNSSALFRSGSKIENEMVRVGIASYGYLPRNSALKFPKLKPVLSLWGEKVGEVKHLKPSFRVGYGGISKVGDHKKVSIYDVGYSDGFRRLPEYILKNELFKSVEGFPLLGKVSMDSIAIASSLERVEIFNSVSDLAELFKTIEYEILVSLNERVKRRVI
jgi:alanine racemase